MLRGVILAVVVLWVSGGFHGLVSAERDSRASLELEDKGYVNLLIGISDRVPNNPALLDRIKFVFSEASQFLFQATKRQAYFKEIHILTPESWDDSTDYSSVQWQRFDQSDVVIDFHRDGQTNNNRPFVNKATPCGEPGQYIHLTPDYILSDRTASSFGPYDKTLTHEWAHYRWGVFDEYPLQNGTHFYADSNGNIEATRCVLKITGRRVLHGTTDKPCAEDENGLPESACRFLDDLEGTGYTGSLMYKQFLPAISTFCENAAYGVPEGNVHNKEAPNLQNRECQGKSIWQVMRQHRDFAKGKGENDVNGDGGGGEEFNGEPVPQFKVVKKQSTRIVLVLDRSGSMEGQRLHLLRQAAEHLINQVLQKGEKLGIVEFEKTARINSMLLTIDEGNRRTLLNELPNIADGGTSIGSGIVEGFEVLQDGSEDIEDAAGGKMIIITDGLDNRYPLIQDVLHLVNGSDVTIDTVAVGPEASPHLEVLSKITGGSAYSLTSNSNSLSDVFSKSSTTEKAVTSQPITLYSEFLRVPANQTFNGAIFIDGTVGHQTNFVFGYSQSNGIAVRLTRPYGTVIIAGSPEYDINPTFLRIRIAIPGDAQIGLWKFEIRNNLPLEEEVTVLVQSQARENQEPILIQSLWRHSTIIPPQIQSLYVSVAQGYTPVVDAYVKAIVDLPSCPMGNETVTLFPKDDGIGADIKLNDGIYSSYFSEFCGQGRYGVNIEVINNGEVTSVASGSIIGVGAAISPGSIAEDSEPELRSTGDFRRVSIGGSFQCEGSSNCSGNVDVYPPARITDLMATNVDPDTKQIRLTFTAPGGDLSTGKASYYVIVVSRNISDIYDNFGNVPTVPEDSFLEGNVTVTKDAGETEVFVITVTEMGSFSYSFAIVAVDNEGNQGEPSNVVTSSARDRRPIEPKPGFPLGLVAGCVVAGVFLLILVMIAAVYVRCKRRQAGGKGTGDPNPEHGKATTDNLYENHVVPPSIPPKPTSAQPSVPLKPPTSPLKPPSASLKPPSAPLKLPSAPPGVQLRSPISPLKLPSALPNVTLKPPISPRPLSGPPSVTLKPTVKPPSSTPRPASTVFIVPTDDQIYEGVISRRDKDPNWDPSLPNNAEGGGANIRPGHVANTSAAFDNLGFLK